jgi:hypothetical protein
VFRGGIAWLELARSVIVAGGHQTLLNRLRIGGLA